MAMTTLLRRCAADRRGSPAVEFALIAPMIILIFIAVFELGMLEICRNDLEAAAREASRFGITGAVPAGKTREQMISDIVDTVTAGLFTAGSVHVTTRVYADFNIQDPEPWTDSNWNGTWDPGESYTDVNKNGQWDSNMAASDAGGSGAIVRYIITARRAYLTPIWVGLMGTTEAQFEVDVLVKNE